MAKELRPPSLVLRVLALPVFFYLLFKSRVLRGEYAAGYCRPCRRQMNVAMFFIAFMVVVMETIIVLQNLGLIGDRRL